jgi:hypothetical protein
MCARREGACQWSNGFFATAQVLTTLHIRFAAGFGLALCMACPVLTVSGSRLVTMRPEAASRLASSGLTMLNEYAHPLDQATIGGMG